MQAKDEHVMAPVDDEGGPPYPVNIALEDAQLRSIVGGQRRRDDDNHDVLFDPVDDLKPKPRPVP